MHRTPSCSEFVVPVPEPLTMFFVGPDISSTSQLLSGVLPSEINCPPSFQFLLLQSFNFFPLGDLSSHASWYTSSKAILLMESLICLPHTIVFHELIN